MDMDNLESLKEKEKRVFIYMRISASFVVLTTSYIYLVVWDILNFEVPIIIEDVMFLTNPVSWIFLAIFSVWYYKIKKKISVIEKE